jgi:PIN domain nuclease of toxin-antitoxin system
MLVLDTCALLWHTLDPARLSDAAISAISQADTILVSSVSLWEIARMEQKGEIELPMELDEYARLLEQVEQYRILPVEKAHWLAAARLNWEHQDPVDRLIVATAELYRSGLVTSDPRMLQWYQAGIW